MLERTHIPEAPWWIVEAVDKKRARLNCIAHLLSQIPYQEIRARAGRAAAARAQPGISSRPDSAGNVRAGDLLIVRLGSAPPPQSMHTHWVPDIPIARAAPLARSSVTPRVYGPRSLITTVTDFPFRGLVTVTCDPNARERCAAV